MGFNPNQFLSLASVTASEYAAGSITNLSSAVQNIAYGLQNAGITNPGLAITAVGELQSVLSSADTTFFSNSPARISADQLSSLRLPGGANTYINTVAPTTVVQNSQNSQQTNVLTFPTDLSQKYYLQLNFAKYNRPAPMAATTFNTELTINLPLPSELIESYSMNYSAGAYGTLGILADQITRSYGGAKNLEGVLKNIGDYYSGGRAVGAALSDTYATGITVANQVGLENITNTIGQFTGVIPNPNPSVTFQGLTLRQHNFTWLMIPRNQEESKTIQNIIHQLRIKCLPAFDSTSDSSLLDYPYVIQPFVFAGINQSLYQFKRCFCTQPMINYTPLGGPAFYGKDNTPFAVQLTIPLMEIEYFTASDFDPNAGGNAMSDLNSAWNFVKNTFVPNKSGG